MVQCSEQSEDKEEDEGNDGYSCLITYSPIRLNLSILLLLYSLKTTINKQVNQNRLLGREVTGEWRVESFSLCFVCYDIARLW